MANKKFKLVKNNQSMHSTGYLNACDTFVSFFEELLYRPRLGLSARHDSVLMIDEKIRYLTEPREIEEVIEHEIGLERISINRFTLNESDWTAFYAHVKKMIAEMRTPKDSLDMRERFELFVRIVFGKQESEQSICNIIAKLLKNERSLLPKAKKTLLLICKCSCHSLSDYEEVQGIISLKVPFVTESRPILAM